MKDRDPGLRFQAESSRAIHPMVDVAALYETGTVAPRVRDLFTGSFAQSAGIGLRVHTDKSGLFRVDFARGRDGFKLALGLSAGI